MPVVPANTITDVPRKVRDELQRLFYERAILQYAFSFEKLAEYMSAEDMATCVVAFNEDAAKTIKADLNDKITTVYTLHGIDKTLRHTDPFGRPKDYIMMSGTSTSFSQNRALEIATAGVYQWDCQECEVTNFTLSDKQVECCKCGRAFKKAPKLKLITFDAAALQAIFDLATNRSTYTTLQARDVKEEADKKFGGKR